MRTHRRNEHRRRRIEFTDRAAGTVQDGYNETKMVEAVRFCWRGQRASAESHLHTAVDFLLSHNLLLRSEMRLGAELPDFFTIQGCRCDFYGILEYVHVFGEFGRAGEAAEMIDVGDSG